MISEANPIAIFKLRFWIRAFSVLLLVQLSACGSGGESATGAQFGNGNDPSALAAANAEFLELEWGQYGPFEGLAKQSDARYSGERGSAQLTDTSASDVVNTLLRGPLLRKNAPRPPGRADQTRGTLRRLLSLGELERLKGIVNGNYPLVGQDCLSGEMSSVHILPVNNSEGANIFRFSYTDCVLPDLDPNRSAYILNGLRQISWKGSLMGETSVYWGYDEYEISNDESHIVLNGVVEQPSVQNCISSRSVHMNLHVSNVPEDENYLFSDFEFSAKGNLTRCSEDTYDWTSLNGKYYHSEYGLWDVRTKDPLRYTPDPPFVFGAYAEDDPSLVDGLVSFHAADESYVTFSFSTTGLVIGSKHQDPLARISIYDSSESEPRVAQTSLVNFYASMLDDLGDTDGDGVPNSWEIGVGSNPEDPEDVHDDTDNDGFNLLEEYLRVGDPNHPSNDQSLIDQSIAVEILHRTINDATGVELFASISGSINDFRVEPAIKIVNVSLEGDARWDTFKLPENCRLKSVDGNVLECDYQYGEVQVNRTFVLIGLVIIPQSEGLISVTARYPENDYDTNRANDEFTAALDTGLELVPDYALNLGQKKVLSSNDGFGFSAKITQQAVARPSDMEVNISVPTGLVVSAADVFSSRSNELISNCDVSQNIVCRLENVKQQDLIDLQVQFSSMDSKNHQIAIDVSSSAGDANLSNNSGLIDVEYIAPIADLQELIDAAIEDSVVMLPAGKYLGTLNGRGKTLTVIGSRESDNSTTIISKEASEPLTENIGARSVYSHLSFVSLGGLVSDGFGTDVSFTNLLITPREGSSYSLDALFYPELPVSYRVANSRIEGWGGDAGTYCHSLFRAFVIRGSSTTVYLDNNLFIDNDCSSLFNTVTERAADYFIQNNTFVDNPVLFRYAGSGSLQTTHFRNNIVVGTETLLHLVDGAFKPRNSLVEPNESKLITASNLLWSSERSVFLHERYTINPFLIVEVADVSADPLFVNEEKGDYRLLSGSPAIDAGSEPLGLVGSNASDLGWVVATERVAVDGNGDAAVALDIGAKEFQP